MGNITRASLIRGAGAVATLSTVLLFAGCSTAPRPRIEAPSPPLQLVEAKPLHLADDCLAKDSVLVEFTVRTDGRTDQVKFPPVSPCVRDALTAWVSSFRYVPPPTETPAAVEWLVVSARKGS